MHIWRIWREETPSWIALNFFLVEGIHELITHARLVTIAKGVHGWLRGHSSAFSIDFAGRPYNTLTLPCECAITQNTGQINPA